MHTRIPLSLLTLVVGMTFGAVSAHAVDKTKTTPSTGLPPATPADNSGINERDRDSKTMTPEDQSQSKADIELAARIRRAVVDHEGLSMDGKNIKIFTAGNAVTLRGPVKDAAEKAAIEKTVRAAGGTTVKVDSQLEVR